MLGSGHKPNERCSLVPARPCRQDAARARPAPADPRWALDNPELWKCGAQPYEQWVSNLAFALLLKVRLCRGLVARRGGAGRGGRAA